MKKEEWPIYWQGLTKKVCEEPCPDMLGLDLNRGKFIYGQNVLNAFHLQVFGQDAFLRNMMQRILKADIAQKARDAPIIVIVPNKREEILDEANKVFVGAIPHGTNPLLFYTQGGSERSVSLNQAMNLFESKTQTHLLIKLEETHRPLDSPLLLHLNSKIKEKFKSEILTHFRPDRPFIYLFCPEDMGTRDHVLEYINGLKARVSFRVFSKNTESLFDCEEPGLVYGPDLYPTEIYEEMRRRSYWELEQKRKWDKKYAFFGDRENSEILKWVKASVAGCAVDQTAFGRFKTPHEQGYEHYWFYPVRQNLGRLAYHRPLKDFQDGNLLNTVKESPRVRDPIFEIINDLKPKTEV